MSILQVTASRELVEHYTLPQEEVHPRLNTIEAQRFIAGMSARMRESFEKLKDADEQEKFIIHKWTLREDTAAIAGHSTSRALQAVRHFLTTTTVLVDRDGVPMVDEDGAESRRYYFPLLEMPKATHISDMHWEMESRFRHGIGEVVARVAGVEAFRLPEITRNKAMNSEELKFSFSEATPNGLITAENEVADFGGMPIGSTYVFSVTGRPRAD